jgi:serine/threonine protein kinase
MPTGARNERTPLPEDLDPILERFELAWQKQPFPPLAAFLPECASGDSQSRPARGQILAELIKIDLEYRWRGPWGLAESAPPGVSGGAGAADRGLPPGKATLEQYRDCFPELRLDDAGAVDLIAEEYRVRMRWGDRPALAQYLDRFPESSGLLRTVLQWVDADLRGEPEQAAASPSVAERIGAETIPLPLRPSSSSAPVQHGQPPASADELLRHLLASRLISPAGLSELRSVVSGETPPLQMHELAKELVHSGWITEYQRDELLSGRFQGLVLGEYAILEKLGEGGMGVVFKAEHRRMERIVALKVLAPAFTTNEAAVSRFHREVKAAAKLVHPNIVLALDAGQEGEVHFLVMEFVLGIDLSRLVKEHGKLPVSKALSYVLQAAQGLEIAHRAGIIHRDIKPANLLLDLHGTVKVADMGLARFHNELGASALPATPSPAASAELTAAGAILGTADYMAPEQIVNPRKVDHRTDIYSLGCTLHFLLTGRPPYSNGSAAERMAAHREAPPPSLSAARPDVSPRLDAAYRRMLEKRPSARHSSAAELIEELQECLREADVARAKTFAGGDSEAWPAPADAQAEAPSRDDSNGAAAPIDPPVRRIHRSPIFWTIVICLAMAGVRAATAVRARFGPSSPPGAAEPSTRDKRAAGGAEKDGRD